MYSRRKVRCRRGEVLLGARGELLLAKHPNFYGELSYLLASITRRDLFALLHRCEPMFVPLEKLFFGTDYPGFLYDPVALAEKVRTVNEEAGPPGLDPLPQHKLDGPSAVGTTSLHVTDGSRPDPWVAEAAARELMVSLWYPATPADGPRARYMTAAESGLMLANAGVTSVPPGTLSTVRTSAVSDAAPAGHPRSLPLVVLSPGFIHPRSVLTALAEDLASHGYVVAGLTTPTRASARSFPMGGSPPAWPVKHPGGTGGRRWWQAGPPTSPSCSAS